MFCVFVVVWNVYSLCYIGNSLAARSCFVFVDLMQILFQMHLMVLFGHSVFNLEQNFVSGNHEHMSTPAAELYGIACDACSAEKIKDNIKDFTKTVKDQVGLPKEKESRLWKLFRESCKPSFLFFVHLFLFTQSWMQCQLCDDNE